MSLSKLFLSLRIQNRGTFRQIRKLTLVVVWILLKINFVLKLIHVWFRAPEIGLPKLGGEVSDSTS